MTIANQKSRIHFGGGFFRSRVSVAKLPDYVLSKRDAMCASRLLLLRQDQNSTSVKRESSLKIAIPMRNTCLQTDGTNGTRTTQDLGLVFVADRSLVSRKFQI